MDKASPSRQRDSMNYAAHLAKSITRGSIVKREVELSLKSNYAGWETWAKVQRALKKRALNS